MRIAFSLAILCVAAFYTSVAFGGLPFLSSAGRLGPGFFPRIIGLSLVAFTLYNLYFDLKRRNREEPLTPFWSTTLVVALLSALFIVGLELIGGLLAMMAFMLVSLFVLNRRQPVVNALISIFLPIGIYVVFSVWLRAGLPEGLLPLPI